MALPVDSSLQGLRESLQKRNDHNPTSSASVNAALDDFINQALQQVALDVPWAFHEETIRFSTDYEFESFDETDTVQLVTISDGDTAAFDEYTLRRTLPLASVALANVWPYDRSIDGAYIEITDSYDVVHTNQIRSVWTDLNNSTPPQYQFITLVRPFIATNSRQGLNSIADIGPFTYRIFHPYVWLPDNIVQIKAMRIVGQAFGQIQVISQDDAERLAIDDYNFNQGTGTPFYAYRRGHFQLDAPSTAPVVAAAGAMEINPFWRGPEPYGTFDYLWTIAWGKRDYDYAAGAKGTRSAFSVNFLEYEHDYDYDTALNTAANYWAENRRREPLFESAPSPISAVATVADPGANLQSPAVKLTFPNLAYQLGFLFDGLANSGGAFSRIADAHSGLHIRIYRRRLTTTIGAGYATLNTETNSQKITTLHKLDDDQSFQLLAEFRPSVVNEGIFWDDGYILPDRTRRLRDINGYQAIRLHPVPNARYEVEARVIKAPAALVNDTDRPRMDPACRDAIILWAASLDYQRMKDPLNSDRMMKMYRDVVSVIARRYADMRPPGRPVRMRPANARGRLRHGGFRAGPIR